MPAHKMTVKYETRQRLKDAVVVRRSVIRRPGVPARTVEDIVARYTDISVAQAIATALNDARPVEVHFAKES
jgi:hypothetical protein